MFKHWRNLPILGRHNVDTIVFFLKRIIGTSLIGFPVFRSKACGLARLASLGAQPTAAFRYTRGYFFIVPFFLQQSYPVVLPLFYEASTIRSVMLWLVANANAII
jgi:hypothetical protein